jgi:hypothetical protein
MFIGASLSTTFVSGDTGGIITLPRINRVAKINSFTGNDVEGTFSATYTKYISDWKEKLRISIPNVVALMTIDNYESGDGVTLDSESITTIQNYMNTNGTNQVVLGGVIETWNGNTKIGESSEINNICTFINAEPTFTYTTTETNSNVVDLLGATSDTVIQNVSKLRVDTTPTAYKGASISKVAITHGNQTYTDTESPYSVDVPVTTNSFTITTTDNRTNSTSQTFTKTMIEYQPVDITSLTMKRQNSTSSNIILNLEAKYYQKTFGSTANVPTVKWKLDDGTYTTIPSTEYTIDTTNNKLTIYNYTLSNVLSYNLKGTFTIEISDLLTTDTDARDVLKGIATYDVGEHDLQINGDLYIADTNRENARKVIVDSMTVVSLSFNITSIPPNTAIYDQVTPIPSNILSNDYTPIGIVGEDKYGAYYANCCFTRLYIDGRDIKWAMANTSSAQAGTIYVIIYILAKKNQ